MVGCFDVDLFSIALILASIPTSLDYFQREPVAVWAHDCETQVLAPSCSHVRA